MRHVVHSLALKRNYSFELSCGADVDTIRDIWTDNVYRVDIQPGMHVLDIGAHKGIFTVYCAIRGAKVTAYEPNPDTFRVLTHNLALNNLDGSVTSRNCGVWWKLDKRRNMYVNRYNAGFSTVLVPEQSNTDFDATVPVMVDDLYHIIGEQEWDVVKMDCEGAEFDAINFGCSEDVLRRIKYLTMEVHHGMVGTSDYEQMMDRLGNVFRVEGKSNVDPRRFDYVYATRR